MRIQQAQPYFRRTAHAGRFFYRGCMDKVCGCCKLRKPLGQFFSPPATWKADAHGTSTYCKQCHAEAKIPHGYGSFVEKYQSPSGEPNPATY